jgi:hydroxymethylbilane synthase
MELPEGFVLPAIMAREDPRDAFVSTRYAAIAELPPGAFVGTSSLRREAQLRERFPHLEIRPLRGNLDTRLAKLDRGEYAGIVLAVAGLRRLGLGDRIREILDAGASLPAAGQGALAIECRADRPEVAALLAVLSDADTSDCVRAERAVSRALGGSCQLPLGAHATVTGGELHMRGLVASPDGRRIARAETRGSRADPEAVGRALADALLGRGAAEILAALPQ